MREKMREKWGEARGQRPTDGSGRLGMGKEEDMHMQEKSQKNYKGQIAVISPAVSQSAQLRAGTRMRAHHSRQIFK